MQEILNIIMQSAENSFLQVTVFVGAVVMLFGYIDYKREGGVVNYIEKHKKFQPIIGALLGLTPGCGGAILVMPLFIRKKVTFGTIIATLIATMGDSAFILVTAKPSAYIIVSIISFIVGVLSGYLIDYLKLQDKLQLNNLKNNEYNIENSQISKEESLTDYEKGLGSKVHGNKNQHIGHEEGDELDYILHHKNNKKVSRFSYEFTHGIGYKIYLGFIVVGLILGIMLLMQIDVNSLPIKNIGMVVGTIGTVFSIAYMMISKKVAQNQNHEEEESKIKSLKESVIHNAGETAFVGTWVFVAYVAYEVIVYFIGGEATLTSMLASTGIIAVIIGAVVGLIPGCGSQIVFVTLYIKGIVPFAALTANAISQDGDALFPLLAMNKKASIWATILTTIPALIVGFIVYIIEIKFFS